MRDAHTLHIAYLAVQHGICREEDCRHIKRLPYLSVVMAESGYYAFGLEDGPLRRIPDGCAFIAPAGLKQTIVHHLDPAQKVMTMKWIFLDAVIDDIYRFDDLYDLPMILPAGPSAKLSGLIDGVSTATGSDMAALCRRQECGYAVLSLLLGQAARKPAPTRSVQPALLYIRSHYGEKLYMETLAAVCGFSPSAFLRHFKRDTGVAPSVYIRDYRLSVASLLLETSADGIAEIAEKTGFYDQFSFSRAFRQKYGVAPTVYRRQMQNNEQRSAAGRSGNGDGGPDTNKEVVTSRDQ